jgi:predicted transcriptional regulator
MLIHWRLLFPIYQDNKIYAVITVIPPVDLYILRISESEKMDMPATVGIESDFAFRVCRTILKYSLRDEKLNAFLLADEIGVNRRTIYRLVNMLSESGLVYKSAEPDDKRRTTYFLTQLGENKVMSNLDRHSANSS